MIRSLLLSVFLLLTATGCTSVTRFEKGNLVAFSEEINGSKERLYYLLWIDNRKSKNPSTPAFLLNIPNVPHPVRTDDLNATFISHYLKRFEPPKQWPQIWKDKAREHPAYEQYGFYISFENNTTSYLSICSHCQEKASPSIGRLDSKAFYTFPLTYAQMIDLFGEPTRKYDVAEVRY